MRNASDPHAPSPKPGWFLPGQSVLFLEREAGIEVLDSVGDALGRFSGSAADALRARLRGGAATPLLSSILSLSPGLERLLDEPALPLSPTHLLGRTHWGQLFVELTARCNERCLHCYASSGPERAEALDRPTVEALVREAGELAFKAIQFTGGEALLCPFLADVARLARDVGIRAVEVYTNGVLLSAQRYAALRDVGVSFAFTLYAATPELHDAVTQLSGSHALTLAGIRRAVDGGSPVRVSVISVRPDLDAEASAAVTLAREHGVTEVRVEIAHAVGRGVYEERERPWVAAPEGEGAEAVRAGGHARAYGGKACVLPDGWVTPCIFSRDVRLGRVDRSGGLRAALERPSASLRRDGAGRIGGDLKASCSRLRCAECRLPTVLLDSGPPDLRL